MNAGPHVWEDREALDSAVARRGLSGLRAQPLAPVSDPDAHLERGLALLDTGRAAEAFGEFELAVYLGRPGDDRALRCLEAVVSDYPAVRQQVLDAEGRLTRCLFVFAAVARARGARP